MNKRNTMLTFVINLSNSSKYNFYDNQFLDFYQNQSDKVKEKIKYVFELVKQVEQVPEKFLKHLTGTDGLYEI